MISICKVIKETKTSSKLIGITVFKKVKNEWQIVKQFMTETGLDVYMSNNKLSYKNRKIVIASSEEQRDSMYYFSKGGKI